jgi:sec-independent protein translocase protein TatA
MMLGELFSDQGLIVLVIVLVLFGSSQLPKLARSLGEARREFEKVTKAGAAEDEAADDAEAKAVEAPAPEANAIEATSAEAPEVEQAATRDTVS